MSTDTFTFTTQPKRRDPQPIAVTWCGEQLTVRRPKDSVLYFSSPAVDNDVAPADRAAAVFEFLTGSLDPADHKRFQDRMLDSSDPLNLRACVELISALMARWNDWPAHGQPEPVVIDEQPHIPLGEPQPIRNSQLDLDFIAYPPKDLVLFLVASAFSGTSSTGRQAQVIGMFLDAALDPADQLEISERLRDRDDDLDLDHLSEIVSYLIEKWSPKQNRAERRAAARAQ